MLVSVSFCWLILTAPFNLHTLLALNEIIHLSRGVHMLLKTICFCLLYLNHSVNLLLYCFTGRKFRLELKVSLLASNTHWRIQELHWGGGVERRRRERRGVRCGEDVSPSPRAVPPSQKFFYISMLKWGFEV